MNEISKYAKNITSQFGEDGIIDFLAKSLGDKCVKTCLEIGAGDGVTFSNTHSLWKNQGWTAILIEVDQNKFNALKDRTKDTPNAIPVNRRATIEGPDSLDGILKQNGVKELGVLSLDIDSIDYHVFKKLKIQPQIIVIEYNNSIPPHIDYFDPEGEVFLRCSLKAIENLGKSKGYSLLGCTITNAILLRSDLYDAAVHPEVVEAEECYDFAGQIKNASFGKGVVYSQLITSYPVFCVKPSSTDRFYFKLRGFARSIAGKERYRVPSKAVSASIKEAGLFL